MDISRSTRYSPLFAQAAIRLSEARSVEALHRGLRTTRSLWSRVDRLIARGELPLAPAEAQTLRRQARYVVDTLAEGPVLNDGEIEQVIEINRQATERLARQQRHQAALDRMTASQAAAE